MSIFDIMCHSAVSGMAYIYVLLIYLIFSTPIGAIGAWRWGIWGLRRLIGTFYRPTPPNDYRPTTSVITPVYNEAPDVFRAALHSWASNGPSELIAVIDHSDERCMQIFQAFTEEWAGHGIQMKMIVTQKPGKRPALVDGMLHSSGTIIFLVDSDTIWDDDVLVNAVAPFVDPSVGGVTTRQNVFHPKALAQRLFDVYLDIRYTDEIRFLTAFGDAVTCLSGRTAVYRRSAVLPVLDDLLHETFFGRPVISGDDKALTLLVQGEGWKVRYQETACVYTPGATEMQSFLKQRLRWARNSWRADLKALFSRWIWRKPILLFHLLDRLVQPLTTLVGPVYLINSAVEQRWSVVLFLLFWWLLSRTIKIWPHLRRNRWNVRILPWYVFFSYWTAIVKIYAFFTMNQQGWITRWNQNRMSLAGPLRMVPGYAFTCVTILTFAWMINGFQYQAVAHAQAAERATPPTRQIAAASQSLPFLEIQAWLTGYCQMPPAFFTPPASTALQPAAPAPRNTTSTP
ncbi:MAG: glycosyltransferase [Caldilineaceae bacterium]|nr:glycosyltransferase [Caldilineaceae bacterium]